MAKKANKSNKAGNISSISHNNNIFLANKKNAEDILACFYFEDFSNEKSVKAFIKNVEKQIRSSEEYSAYIGHLNCEIGIDRCQVFGNITNEDEIDLEFHHYPFTLYDICEIVVISKSLENEKFTSMDIVEEVLRLHSLNQVGLVKLCETAHQLTHDGKIFIPLDCIFGRVEDFIDTYKSINAIPNEMIEKFNKLVDMNEIEFDDSILKVLSMNETKIEDIKEKLIEGNEDNLQLDILDDDSDIEIEE